MRLYKAILTFIFLFWCISLNAQSTHWIKGTVQDSTFTAIAGATVSLINKTDTAQTTTTAQGKFNFNGLKKSSYEIIVSSMEHLTYKGKISFADHQDTLNLSTIILSTITHKLNEVTIKAPKPIVLKKDTIEYSADAFNVRKDDRLADLLKQLPGVEIDNDGNVTNMGTAMTKLRINGKDFFTGNIKDFLSQLPADIFDKLQIIDDYGDVAAFTKIKTGKPAKMLNLVTKPGMNRGEFGNLNLKAGTDKRLGSDVNANYWRDIKQIGGNFNLNTSKNTSGLSNTNTAYLSYGDEINKHLTFTTNYNFYNLRNNVQSSSNVQSVNELGLLYTNTNSFNAITSKQQGCMFEVNYKPDTATYLIISSDIGLANGSNANNSASVQTGIIRQDLKTISESTNSSPTIHTAITYNRFLSKKGRLISAGVNINKSNTDGSQQISNEIVYYDQNNNPAKDSLLNRLIKNPNRSLNTNLNITYTEPLTTHAFIDVSYKLNFNAQHSNLTTDVTSATEAPHRVDSLSNSVQSHFLTQRGDITYRYQNDKLTLNQGISFQQNTLSNNSSLLNNTIKQNVNSVFPVTKLQYILNKSNSLNFDYNGTSNAPLASELQPVKDIHDLQNVIIGNPDLKPSINHAVNLGYTHVDIKTQQQFMLYLNGGITQNQVVSNTTFVKDTLNSLRQETRYLNANGNYMLGSYYNYSIPLGSATVKKIRVGIHGSINYNHNILFSDDIKNTRLGVVLNQSVSLNGNFNKLNFSFNTQYSNNYTHYTAGTGLNNTLKTWQFSMNGNFKITKNFTLGTNANKQVNSGFTNNVSSNPLVVNVFAEQALFKKQFNIKLQGFDLFNQANQVHQMVTTNSVVDSKSNYITRYALLSLNWRLSNFGGKM